MIRIFLPIVLFVSCKKTNIDPHQAILGKWEEFYVGNGEYSPPMTPNAYIQFLPDSVLLEYAYDTKTTFTKKYWIDSLLHIGTVRGDGYLLKFDYSYLFDGDTLRLDLKNANAIFYVSKYKRIN